MSDSTSSAEWLRPARSSTAHSCLVSAGGSSSVTSAPRLRGGWIDARSGRCGRSTRGALTLPRRRTRSRTSGQQLLVIRQNTALHVGFGVGGLGAEGRVAIAGVVGNGEPPPILRMRHGLLFDETAESAPGVFELEFLHTCLLNTVT